MLGIICPISVNFVPVRGKYIIVQYVDYVFYWWAICCGGLEFGRKKTSAWLG
jgi:hypothetical protein